eukprot:Skav202826  [mRNA]  locus=scaffold3852:192174:193262:- [translate_table: standard]
MPPLLCHDCQGLENVQGIKEKLAKGENVVLMANHQTEADPQVLSLLLQREGYEELAEKCIFVAGHKAAPGHGRARHGTPAEGWMVSKKKLGEMA